jgi:hypothetical protein
MAIVALISSVDAVTVPLPVLSQEHQQNAFIQKLFTLFKVNESVYKSISPISNPRIPLKKTPPLKTLASRQTTVVYNTIMTSLKRLDEIINLLSYEVTPTPFQRISTMTSLTSPPP